MSVTHDQKVTRFTEELRSSGYSVANAIPPAFRMLWRLGVEIPPPYFLPFPVAVLASGVPFGVLFGSIMWVVSWRASGISSLWALFIATAAGALFGLTMAALWWHKRHKLDLPSWADYPPGSSHAA